MDIKSQISIKYLKGTGLELGPLNNPLPMSAENAKVLYADRLPKSEALQLFPELRDIADSLIDADLLIDFDTDPLTVIRDKQLDFVIANHVIEHLVNPIQFLKNVSDNLKLGGRFFLTVPDKDFTFDRKRKLTTSEHLWKEYAAKVSTLSNAHIKEFLINKEAVAEIHPEVEKYFINNGLPLSYYQGNKIPLNPIKRRRLYNFHRQRSIHVHVWNSASFDSFLAEVNEKLQLSFHKIDSHTPGDVVGEMIYLLEKT